MIDYCSNARKPQTVVCTEDIFKTVINSVTVSSVCAEIKDALEKVKRGEMSREDFETFKKQEKIKLPAFLFQAHFTDGHRHNESAVPSGLGMFDLDHIGGASPQPSPEGEGAAIPQGEGWHGDEGEAIPLSRVLINHVLMMQPITDAETIGKLKELGIVLAHVTPSTEGLRLVFVLNDGETPMQGQKRLAKTLGLETYDESVKDLARCSFAVPESYVLYVDYGELFKEREANGAADTVAKNQPTEQATAQPTVQQAQPTVQQAQSTAAPAEPLPQSVALFEAAVKETGLEAGSLDTPGYRHLNLVTVLSTGITRLMPREQMEAVVRKLFPHGDWRDLGAVVRDFYEKYTDNNKPMSRALQRLYVSTLRKNGMAQNGTMQNGSALNGSLQNGSALNGSNGAAQQGGQAASTLPDDSQPMDDVPFEKRVDVKDVMQRMPEALQVTVGMVPENMRMPVLCSIMPLLACYAFGVTVRYCDNMIQHLGMMAIIVGPQASGKSSCTNAVRLWERQLDEEDEKAWAVEEKYKDQNKRKADNEKGVEEPKVLMRVLPITISNSKLLNRLKKRRNQCLWSFGEELDTLRKSNSAGNWAAKYDVYRMAFDYGRWGQDYNTDQAESGMVNVAYNWSCLGTYGALNKCFKDDNIENGLSSRMIVAEMPDCSFSSLPVYTQPTKADLAVIDAAVQVLKGAQGFLDTPRLREAMGEWLDKKLAEASMNIDDVLDTYRKRAAVIGFRCGVIATILTGSETDDVLDFARMIAEYVCFEQCRLFGEVLHKTFAANKARPFQKCNGNVYMKLPQRFSLADLANLKGPDAQHNTLVQIISRWKKNGWVRKLGVNCWEKLSDSQLAQKLGK